MVVVGTPNSDPKKLLTVRLTVTRSRVGRPSSAG